MSQKKPFSSQRGPLYAFKVTLLLKIEYNVQPHHFHELKATFWTFNIIYSEFNWNLSNFPYFQDITINCNSVLAVLERGIIRSHVN